MKKNFIKIFGTTLILISACLISCNKSDDPVKRREYAVSKLFNTEKKIKIAVAGPWGQKRNHLMDGLTMAKDEINSQGGVLGAQIELVPFDDNSNITVGQNVAYQISEDEEIGAVIGHSASSVSIANSLVYHYYGILQFTPLSTNKKLTHQGLDYVFRNIPQDEVFGTEAAKFCEHSLWSRVMIYYLNNDYGEGLANAFELQCSYSNITILDRTSYESVYSLRDYTEVVTEWKDNYNFDAIFVAGSMPQAGEIVSVFRSLGITQPIIGGDAFDVPMFFQVGNNETAENVFTVTNFDADSKEPAYISFLNNYKARFNQEPDQASLQGYDALKVLTDAMVQANSIKPSDISKVLKSADKWEEAAGPYNFDENGDIINRNVIIKKAVDGAFVKVNE